MISEKERKERLAVVTEALAWLRTPYHMNASIKGAGVDCGTLLIACFANVGLIDMIEPEPLKPDFHLHRGDEIYTGWLSKYCREMPAGYEPQQGDIVTYRYGRLQSAHGAVVVNWPKIIHADRSTGVTLAENIADRQTAVWSFWGKP